MSRGYLTIETALSIILVLMVLEVFLTLSQSRSDMEYSLLEGNSTCDVACLLAQE
jgi:hypothetical protein